MGRYIDDILQPGEKVLYSTNAHWIFYLPAIAAWVVAIVFLVLSRMFVTDTPVLLCLSLAAISAIFALYKMLTAWFHRWTTETDVTNLRVVHKAGFIKRRTFEMSLDKVESVDVNQSILGRILNYGDVTVRGVGEGAETIKTIASPLDFRNHITAR
ncbi:PH domain-containing protein [Bradyrhizobium canariense]|uniref:PH domain-containing protein n=1 Tax=Bradyrhizobium canariense TaxID=255045 RepID=A0A1H1ZIZ6_9BRAD|nr:PH domain-containing protein [Bradyrhizobium canariense]SDT33698.1 PH domain-containing protein [Bradyrhizobium canariense]